MKHTFLKLERKAKKKRPKLENEEKSYESPKLIDINNLEVKLCNKICINKFNQIKVYFTVLFLKVLFCVRVARLGTLEFKKLLKT